MLKDSSKGWKTLNKRTRIKKMTFFDIAEHLRISGVFPQNLKNISQNMPFDPHITLSGKSVREISYWWGNQSHEG